MDWVEILDELMKSEDWSARRAGIELGFSNQSINNVLLGTTKPNSLMKAKIWEKLGNKFDDLDMAELIDEKTMEFIAAVKERDQIEDIKNDAKNKKYKDVLNKLLNYRKWTVEELSKDSDIDVNRIRAILNGEEPTEMEKFKIKDRTTFDFFSEKFAKWLPEHLRYAWSLATTDNYKRIAKKNDKKT